VTLPVTRSDKGVTFQGSRVEGREASGTGAEWRMGFSRGARYQKWRRCSLALVGVRGWLTGPAFGALPSPLRFRRHYSPPLRYGATRGFRVAEASAVAKGSAVAKAMADRMADRSARQERRARRHSTSAFAWLPPSPRLWRTGRRDKLARTSGWVLTFKSLPLPSVGF
jgi:hypothetical protein